MPKIAILSDIHANEPALKAVLRDVAKGKIGRIVCCGDTVGYGASSNACVSRLQGLGVASVMGNHDFYTNHIRRYRTALPANRDWRKNPVWAGVEEAARLIGILRALVGECTIVLVEHDMDAVFALADTVTVLAEGRILASGSPAEIRQNVAVRAVYLGDTC